MSRMVGQTSDLACDNTTRSDRICDPVRREQRENL